MKFRFDVAADGDRGSLSLRRAWIEIPSQTPRAYITSSRSPYGERGLKSLAGCVVFDAGESLSLRRAWIEILFCLDSISLRRVSLSLRRAWIEISRMVETDPKTHGRSPYGERGLKSVPVPEKKEKEEVALLTESVD